MTGEIIKAVMDEGLACLQAQGQGGTLILKTNYRHSQRLSYTMPLVLIELTGAPRSFQLLGGLTQMEWQFAFNAYNLMPDPYDSDPTGYSTGLLNNPIDGIRQHFSAGHITGWLTPGMAEVLSVYGFRFTLSGLQPADALDEDGQALGYRILFDSVAFDPATQAAAPSAAPLQSVQQGGG